MKSSGLAGIERVAELVFQNGQTVMPPIAVRLPDLRSLVSAAIYVLVCYGDEFGHALASAVRSDATKTTTPMPIAPAANPSAAPATARPKPDDRKKPSVIPSIRPNGPHAPISEGEVWLIHRMLQNVRSNDDFLRLIGVPESDIMIKQPPTTLNASKPRQACSRKQRRGKKR
jgi:hypothetical protein